MKKATTLLAIAATSVSLGGLLSANSFAAELDCANVSSGTDFQACLDAGEDITLSGDIIGTSTFTYDKNGSSISVDLNGKKIVGNNNTPYPDVLNIKAGEITFAGDGTIGDANAQNVPMRIYGSLDEADTLYTVVNVNSGVSLETSSQAIVIDHDSNRAHGVVLNFAGGITATDGIYVVEELSSREYYPIINILSTADIMASDGHAIVAGGYASWNIADAKLEGNSGIGIKQGKFLISGANVIANGTNVTAPVVLGHGMSNSGAAIQIEAIKDSTNYSDVYIDGSSVFSSEHGYAILEYASDEASKGTSLGGFTVYTGAFAGTPEFENSVVYTSTGAFTWYHGDGRILADGSRFLEVEDLWDSHQMTVVRFANSVTGIDAIYADPNYSTVERILPVFTPYDGLIWEEIDALNNSDYKDSHIVNVFDITLRMFEEGIGEPEPGTGRPFTIIDDTTDKYPITFNLNLPEIEPVADGYVREYYMLNFHMDLVTGEYKIEKLPINLNEDGKTFSFSTHKFSTFTLAYTDTLLPLVPDTGYAQQDATEIAATQLTAISAAMLSLVVVVGWTIKKVRF